MIVKIPPHTSHKQRSTLETLSKTKWNLFIKLWLVLSTRLCRFDNGHCLLDTDSLNEHKCLRSSSPCLLNSCVITTQYSNIKTFPSLIKNAPSHHRPPPSCFYKMHFNIILTPTLSLMFFWPYIINWLYINYQLDALIIIYS